MTTATAEFSTQTHENMPEEMLPHKAGRKLWLPMLLMAIIGFGVGIVLAFVRADAVNSGDTETVAVLGQLVPGFMFIGFATVFAAIAFAVARILGVFREGGSGMQKMAGSEIKTLEMPATGKAFMVLMVLGMMTLVVAVVLHFIVGGAIAADSAWAVDNAETWSIALEGARRFGVSVYLLSIAFGLATIIIVLRFQSLRVREIVAAK